MAVRAGLGLEALLVALTVAADVHAHRVERLRVAGNARTQASVVESVLPCELPCEIDEVGRAEIERRLYNLAIFDAVAVSFSGAELRVELSEKWTLIPYATFSTGESIEDLFIAIGVTEYNLFGTATMAELSLSWEQRGPNAYLFWADHDYDARHGGLLGSVDYTSSSFRFEDGHEWYRDAASLTAGWKLPFVYGSPLRWTVSLAFAYEKLSRVQEFLRDPNGFTFGSTLSVVYDRYAFRDLAPSGFKLDASVSTAAFVPAGQARHEISGGALLAWALTDTTVVMGRAIAAAVTAGNPNHSLLLGSLDEVRGVEDAFYRNRSQLVGNVELRQAVRIASGWAIQGALFCDAAWFEPFDSAGVPQPPLEALSLGGGLRVVPTFIAEVVLRFDVSHLFEPYDSFFWQLAFSQFF